MILQYLKCFDLTSKSAGQQDYLDEISPKFVSHDYFMITNIIGERVKFFNVRSFTFPFLLLIIFLSMFAQASTCPEVVFSNKNFFPNTSIENSQINFLPQNFSNGFRTPEFYEWFEENSANTWPTFQRWYSKIDNYKEKFLDAKKILGPSRVSLILDPGILSRLNTFLRFSKKVIRRNQSILAIDLRQEFSDYLGSKTIHRGLVLGENKIDIQSLVDSGLAPRVMFDEQFNLSDPRLNSSLFKSFLIDGPFIEIEKRFGNSETESLLTQSYSGVFKISRVFAQAGGFSLSKIKKKGYVISASVPIIETTQLLDLFPNFIPFPSNLLLKGMFIELDGKRYWLGRKHTELFVIGKVEPDWITDIKSYDVIDDDYEINFMGHDFM